MSDPRDLPGAERYAEFLVQAIGQGQVWALKGEGGFVAFADESRQPCFPFWPDPDAAAAAATADWSDCLAEPIALDVFMTRWLPGMAKDGRLAAVWPDPDGSGVVVTAETLLQDLREEQEAQRD